MAKQVLLRQPNSFAKPGNRTLTHFLPELLLREPPGPHLFEELVSLTHHGPIDLPTRLIEETFVLVLILVILAVLFVGLLKFLIFFFSVQNEFEGCS